MARLHTLYCEHLLLYFQPLLIVFLAWLNHHRPQWYALRRYAYGSHSHIGCRSPRTDRWPNSRISKAIPRPGIPHFHNCAHHWFPCYHLLFCPKVSVPSINLLLKSHHFFPQIWQDKHVVVHFSLQHDWRHLCQCHYRTGCSYSPDCLRR